MEGIMAQTVTYIYDDPSLARQAIQALEDAGFSSDEISIVRQGGEAVSDNADSIEDGATTGASIGLAAGAGAGLLASLGLIAIPGIGPLVAAGVLATTLTAGAAGAVGGGLVGALMDYGISEEEAPVYAENLRRGGTLLSVRTTPERLGAAELIMQRYSPVDIGERATAYRDEGWTGYDPDAPAYTRDEVMNQRRRAGTR
jgi:hypothetical protein